MPYNREQEARSIAALYARCLSLIDSTDRAIIRTQDRVHKAGVSVARQRERGIGCETITLRPGRVRPTLVDAEIYDDADSRAMLNEAVEACSCCGSKETLVAFVRFPSIDVEMALCGACYQSLEDRALGQVT
jgi:hypothetical protein